MSNCKRCNGTRQVPLATVYATPIDLGGMTDCPDCKPMRRANTDHYADVFDFHRKFACAIGSTPALPAPETAALRMSLINEERDELQEAIDNRDIPKVADAIADLLYVVYGTAVTFGIDIRPVWDEVHASNMRKEGGATRADGKILKPAGWQPPDVAGVLRKQGWDGGQRA